MPARPPRATVAVLDALAANEPRPERVAQAHPDGPRPSIPALARETIGGIVAKAVELGAFVRIDMEDHTTTDSTLALWRDVRPATWQDGGADVGLVIQSALRRSDDDIEAIIAEGGRVRLCKGAYKEPASVAYQDKADVDAAYERQMLRLMRAGRYPAIATHDVRLIKRAVDVARAEGIAQDAFEFQMLYGVRRDIQEQLVGAGWTGSHLRPVRRRSGTRTSCAAWRSDRRTCRSSCATCGGSAAGADRATRRGRRCAPGRPRRARESKSRRWAPAAQASAVGARRMLSTSAWLRR